MTPSARLSATIELLTAVADSPRPVDAVTPAFFRAHREIEEQDRGIILDQVYSLLRHRARLGWWLARLGVEATPRAQVLAWLALVGGKGSEEVRKLVGGVLDLPRGAVLTPPEMPEAVALECPDWAEAPLRARFGAGFAAEMAAMLQPPPLDLRVNPVKTTREAVLREFRRLALPAAPTPLSELGIRLSERVALHRLPGLKTGAVEIQDEGSQLVAALVGAEPGEQVVDFCAGAGGKTLALAAQMGNRGHLVACDTSAARLKRAAERLRAAGLQNAETRVLTGETDKWIKRHKLGFDRVLVDAPCSGTGTWRRNPDARWRAPDLGLSGLVALQGRILASAARLVKPGGRLVYATCSVLTEENEAQVAAFLATTPGFRRVPVSEVAPGLTQGLDLSLTPLQNGTDGFFAAVLQRA